MIYLIPGRRENGKTTLAYYMASKFDSRLIFDPRGLLGGAGSLQVRGDADLTDAVDELFFLQQSEVIYAPAGDDLERAFMAFSLELKRWVLDQPRGRRLAVVVDEASFVPLMNGAFQWVLRCAPRTSVHLFVTTHRPVDIPVLVRAIADHWLIFPVRQEHDLRVIAERCSPDTADIAATLAPREFVHWDDERAQLATCRTPATWYRPLNAPAVVIEETADDIDPALRW